MAIYRNSAGSSNVPLLPPSAEMEDQFILSHLSQASHAGVNAFFVALAAWQRGLKVTFHFQIADKSPRFRASNGDPSEGAFLSVSDGRKEHFFIRTLGERVSLEASMVSKDKLKTKKALVQHNIPVPTGILIDKSLDYSSDMQRYLQKHADMLFHVKPVVGSLSRGTRAQLTASAVPSVIIDHTEQLLLLEEHIQGFNLRVNVVGGQYVGSYALKAPVVEGDGISTVAELVEQRNAQRRNKFLHPGRLIKIGDFEKSFLADQGLTASSVPEIAEKVTVSPTLQSAEGADFFDYTDLCPEVARDLAIKSCWAIGVSEAGVDLLFDELSGRCTVLEINVCPMLKGNMFPFYTPSPGNRIAEAIIDEYFPSSKQNKRFTRASFDFFAVCRSLKSGAVSEVVLPQIKETWVQRRFKISRDALQDDGVDRLRSFAAARSVHLSALAGKSTYYFNLLGERSNIHNLLRELDLTAQGKPVLV